MKQNYTQAENVLTDCVSSCLDKLLDLKAFEIRDEETSVFVAEQRSLIESEVKYTIEKISILESTGSQFLDIASDVFNRSFNRIKETRKIDDRKMRSNYKGVGSRYYDEVTGVMEQYQSKWNTAI